MLKLTPGTKLYLLNIAIICLIGIGYGLIYNWAFYPHKLVEFVEAGTIGLFIGLLLCYFELISLRNTYSRLPFWQVLFLRTFLYSVIISIVLGMVLSIETVFENNVGYGKALLIYFGSDLFVRDFAFSIFFIPFILTVLQFIQLVGAKKILHLITGVYHRPKQSLKIFMFADLKDSTVLAEQLSNKDYSNMLKDFFFDLSEAVIQYGGEIYQYVGDEMVIVWPAKVVDTRAIASFFKMKETLVKRKNDYLSKYGIVPEFKAGLHFGSVIVTEVGKYKKDIVYHGDVMNTSSRIEGKCKELNEQILISDPLLEHLESKGNFIFDRKGEIPLRGKKEAMILYGVRVSKANP